MTESTLMPGGREREREFVKCDIRATNETTARRNKILLVLLVESFPTRKLSSSADRRTITILLEDIKIVIASFLAECDKFFIER